MQGNDVGIPLPAAVPQPELKFFVLHSPFAAILKDFLLDQRWVPDSEGFTVCEFYVYFTKATWMGCADQHLWHGKLWPSCCSPVLDGTGLLGPCI